MSMTRNAQRLMGAAAAMCILCASSLQAQNTVRFSGLIFSDYEYTFRSHDGNGDGENGFGYRRFYLTTDFGLGDNFSGRFRLEAADSQASSTGRPTPFVKDAWIKWSDSFAEGHDIVFGVSPTPIWGQYESFQGYRSLSRMFMDRNGLASTRDLGIQFAGPINSDGSVRYGLMVANNSGISAETDKYKRIYGQIAFKPNGRVFVNVGADYYGFENGSSWSIDAFAGYAGDGFRLGAEGAYNPVSYDTPDREDRKFGGSAFIALQTSETSELLMRIDHVLRDDFGVDTNQAYFVTGYAVRPVPHVQIIPNLQYETGISGMDPEMTGRLTVVASF